MGEWTRERPCPPPLGVSRIFGRGRPVVLAAPLGVLPASSDRWRDGSVVGIIAVCGSEALSRDRIRGDDAAADGHAEERCTTGLPSLDRTVSGT